MKPDRETRSLLSMSITIIAKSVEYLEKYANAMREAIAILEEEDIAAQDCPAERAYCVLTKALEEK